ncbi:MAG TPA: CbiX/SirB N-terminal domain-containing protein [Terriglobia bacterium]|nr:CbiX/SirB N-terminal domain-containing protein [Terriglobia bacterium]
MTRSNETTNETTGIIIFAHGSRVEEANAGVRELAGQVEQTSGLDYVRAAFLEFAQPDLATAVAEAVGAGRRRLIVVPYFLTMGVHLQRDLPGLIAQERDRHPSLEIRVGDSLERHPRLPSLILDRIHAVMHDHES